VDRIVLAGPDPVVAEFEKGLHTWLAERVVARSALPMRAGLAKVREATLEVEERLEEERVGDLVARLEEELEAKRLAVAGLTATVDAVQQGRADVVVVSDGEAQAGWRCRACGALSLREGACPACGGDLSAVPNMIEEVVDLAMRRGCQIVRSDRLPGDIGALLRF
jgi:molybdopterin converting factor small subunit